jgi:hypothetical protein
VVHKVDRLTRSLANWSVLHRPGAANGSMPAIRRSARRRDRALTAGNSLTLTRRGFCWSRTTHKASRTFAAPVQAPGAALEFFAGRIGDRCVATCTTEGETFSKLPILARSVFDSRPPPQPSSSACMPEVEDGKQQPRGRYHGEDSRWRGFDIRAESEIRRAAVS